MSITNPEPFFGLRATDDFTVTGQRPQNWREAILYLYPNGDAPLTALMAKMANERTDDPHFHWFTKGLPKQAGDLNDIFSDEALTTPVAVPVGVGIDVYAGLADGVNKDQFRVGHTVMSRKKDDQGFDIIGIVTAVGTSSGGDYVRFRPIETDNDGSGNSLLAAGNYLLIVGNANAEGGPIPDAISYDPEEHENYTQIFRTPLEITRTARLTRLRTGDAYKEAKREALELQSIELEKSLLWGVRYMDTGANGKPRRFTQGLIPSIKQESGNVTNYAQDPDFSGMDWLTGGEAWLDKWLEVLFRYGSDTRMCYVGSGALLEINKLIKHGGLFEFTPKTYSYGIKAFEWVTPFGTIVMKRHPLFSYEETNRYSMVLFDPTDLKGRYITDTTFFGESKKVDSSHERYDGTKEEYLTEIGMEYHFPIKCGYFYGIGDTNVTARTTRGVPVGQTAKVETPEPVEPKQAQKKYAQK